MQVANDTIYVGSVGLHSEMLLANLALTLLEPLFSDSLFLALLLPGLPQIGHVRW